MVSYSGYFCHLSILFICRTNRLLVSFISFLPASFWWDFARTLAVVGERAGIATNGSDGVGGVCRRRIYSIKLEKGWGEVDAKPRQGILLWSHEIGSRTAGSCAVCSRLWRFSIGCKEISQSWKRKLSYCAKFEHWRNWLERSPSDIFRWIMTKNGWYWMSC